MEELLRAGTAKFRETFHATNKRFETTENESIKFEFTGFNIERFIDGKLDISQDCYLRWIEEIPERFDYGAFISKKCVWIGCKSVERMFRSIKKLWRKSRKKN